MNPMGVMTIGWDRPMQPYKSVEKIPPTKVAVDINLMRDVKEAEDEDSVRLDSLFSDPEERVQSSSGRRLQQSIKDEVWFRDSQRDERRRMMLLDALEVQMVRIKDREDVPDAENFRWTVINFDRDFIWLQISFDNP